MSNQEDKRDEVPGQNKVFSIIINGRATTIDTKKITYEEVVALASAKNDEMTISTVTFERGEQGKAKGSLTSGDDVVVKDRMVFNVKTTNRS